MELLTGEEFSPYFKLLRNFKLICFRKRSKTKSNWLISDKIKSNQLWSQLKKKKKRINKQTKMMKLKSLKLLIKK